MDMFQLKGVISDLTQFDPLAGKSTYGCAHEGLEGRRARPALRLLKCHTPCGLKIALSRMFQINGGSRSKTRGHNCLQIILTICLLRNASQTLS